MAQKDEAGTFFLGGIRFWVPLALGQMCILSPGCADYHLSPEDVELLDRESEGTSFALMRGDAKEKCANCQRKRLVPKRTRAAK